ncbi:hypothetical protein Q7P37_003908 [Cladosporium fusiforme]
MPTTHTHLYGSCACERNQYAIAIPQNHPQTPSHAHVFFDNSRATRRSQAAPLTAWLRIPLAWYNSSTQAFFPDESHASIRRTFYTPASLASGGEVRKQFCGYCGTHLSAWRDRDSDGSRSEEEWMDVTLGSLWSESVSLLEEMGWVGGESSEEEEGGIEESAQAKKKKSVQISAAMRNRGMPFFEELMEDSRLGRIKRQRGGHAGADGRSRVEWEITEIESGGGDGEDAVMQEGESVESGNGNKRLKLGD